LKLNKVTTDVIKKLEILEAKLGDAKNLLEKINRIASEHWCTEDCHICKLRVKITEFLGG